VGQQTSANPLAPAVPVKVSINAIMVDLVDHASHEIWDATGDPKDAPKNNADWAELEHHATQLASAGSLIMLGGTGKADMGWVQQTPWKQYSQALADAGAAARDAVRARNLQALSQAGDQLVNTCESCHKEFKPEAPTEGIVHQHEEYSKK
jgi:cytochrome c556